MIDIFVNKFDIFIIDQEEEKEKTNNKKRESVFYSILYVKKEEKICFIYKIIPFNLFVLY